MEDNPYRTPRSAPEVVAENQSFWALHVFGVPTSATSLFLTASFVARVPINAQLQIAPFTMFTPAVLFAIGGVLCATAAFAVACVRTRRPVALGYVIPSLSFIAYLAWRFALN